jgi:type VI secretion system protein ImpM
MDAPGIEVGFYGKLPSHGDFLRRRVPDAFVEVWDSWLQECLVASRVALADRWLDIYLTSPAWRFVAAAGLLGPQPVIGLLVPSVDRVGRYFHLTIAATLPGDVDAIDAVTRGAVFLDHAEQLAIDTLAADAIQFETFDAAVRALADHLAVFDASTVRLAPEASSVLADSASECWRIPLISSTNLEPMFREIFSRRMAALYDPLVVWWTDGSECVEPTCLLGRGLPAPESFAALMDGIWLNQPWRSLGVAGEPAAAPEPDEDLTPPRFRSAGDSNVGKVRSVNQDSYLERADAGLWVVADGLGGLSQGEVASRMVCDALADLTPAGGFEDMVDAASERLSQVNSQLVHAAERAENAVRSGSTVVALLTRGTRFVILWAGDSRAYRLRDGLLEQLSRDHSETELDGVAHSTAITRAVGGEATLSLDMVRGRVAVGDRFLLCSDGLSRTVPEAQIRELLQRADIRQAVDGLIQATLLAGAPDNVTAVVVEGFSQPGRAFP